MAQQPVRRRRSQPPRAAVTVRPLQRQEIPALGRVLDEAGEAQLRNRWHEQDLGYRELMGAELDGELVGTVSIRHNATAESMHLFALEVATARRGEGIGGAIVEWVIEEARRRDCTRVYLEVRTDNPARRLYHRLGFRRVGSAFVNTWWRFNDNGTRDRVEEQSLRMVKRLY
ncbi:MAG: GNAT family N-acetyltransferase [Dehalococcoidia bacterium]